MTAASTRFLRHRPLRPSQIQTRLSHANVPSVLVPGTPVPGACKYARIYVPLHHMYCARYPLLRDPAARYLIHLCLGRFYLLCLALVLYPRPPTPLGTYPHPCCGIASCSSPPHSALSQIEFVERNTCYLAVRSMSATNYYDVLWYAKLPKLEPTFSLWRPPLPDPLRLRG